MKKKVVIAVGGTGGHLFPAQSFAEELDDAEVVFIGKGLAKNSYFDRKRFTFHDVESMTPFRGKWRSAYLIIKGVITCLSLLSKIKPDLVVGFGSFHAFPVLVAARLHRVPIALFESNAMPGKVIRLFSKKAKVTGIYMDGAKKWLKGHVVSVEMPFGKRFKESCISKADALQELGLVSNYLTLLVLGGSQGAQKLNATLLELLPFIKQERLPWQLIHLTGSDEMSKEIAKVCKALDIPCYVKPFDKKMSCLFQAADLAVCRAGAVTVAELLHHAIPSILIPYPSASDAHQEKNARFVQDVVQGGIELPEQNLSAKKLLDLLISLDKEALLKREKITQFKAKENRPSLATLVRGL